MILSSLESRDRDHNSNIYGNDITAGSPLKSASSKSNGTTASEKSIDDVWDDISLSSFHHRTTTPARTATTTTTTTHPSYFQDFFAPPSANPSCPAQSPRFTPPPIAAAAATATVVGLNSGPCSSNLHKISLSTSQPCSCTEPNITSSVKSTNFPTLPTSSSSLSLPMKRPDPDYCEKHKRLMKNRESAARSRARKQARADELELEVERLTKENAMLKRQQQEQKLANATPARLPKKSRLQRTLTAPF